LRLEPLLVHGILEGAHNRRQDRTTGPAANELPDHGADVGPATRGPLEGRYEQRQELPTTQTTKGASNGVAGRAEAEVLQARARGIAADDPGDELDNWLGKEMILLSPPPRRTVRTSHLVHGSSNLRTPRGVLML